MTKIEIGVEVPNFFLRFPLRKTSVGLAAPEFSFSDAGIGSSSGDGPQTERTKPGRGR
jgi:hypothetical protein